MHVRIASMPVATVVSELPLAFCPGRRGVLQGAALACLVAAPSQRLNAQAARLPALSLKFTHATASGIATVNYDGPSLAALGSVQVTTAVPWNREPHVWEGVPIRRLLEAVRATGRPLRLKALNDYEATIPWDDIERFDPILAWFEDGQPIPVRAKGPLLVIYPFDSSTTLRRAEFTDRSVWHVSEASVE